MESYCEYLVRKRQSPINYVLITLVWVAAFILTFFVILLANKFTALFGILIVAIAGIFYGAFRLVQLFDIEYEMIAVNKDLDIDKITAKRSRKRMITVHLDKIDEYGEYNETSAEKLKVKNFDFKLNCANEGDKAAYIIYRHPKKGLALVVIPLSEKLEKEILKYIPRILINK